MIYRQPISHVSKVNMSALFFKSHEGSPEEKGFISCPCLTPTSALLLLLLFLSSRRPPKLEEMHSFAGIFGEEIRW